jgi:hypothetical protein
MPEELPIDKVAEIARRRKLEVVAKYGDDPDEEMSDLRGFVAVVRDGEVKILVYVGHGPLAPRGCVYWAAAMGNADEVVLVTDARMKFEMVPPELENASEEEKKAFLDAQDDQIEPGDFQRAWVAGDREGLTECLFVHRFPALGPSHMVTYPYVRDGRKLTWGQKMDHGSRLDGAIPKHARGGFETAREKGAQVHQLVQQVGEAMGLPEAEREVFIDRALARSLSEKKEVGMVGVIADGSHFVAGIEHHDN